MTHERLAHLAELEPGWLDGDGRAISAVALGNAERALPLLPDGWAVFPTPGGGVQFEWTDHNSHTSFELSRTGILRIYQLVLPRTESRHKPATVEAGCEILRRLREAHA